VEVWGSEKLLNAGYKKTTILIDKIVVLYSM